MKHVSIPKNLLQKIRARFIRRTPDDDAVVFNIDTLTFNKIKKRQINSFLTQNMEPFSIHRSLERHLEFIHLDKYLNFGRVYRKVICRREFTMQWHQSGLGIIITNTNQIGINRAIKNLGYTRYWELGIDLGLTTGGPVWKGWLIDFAPL